MSEEAKALDQFYTNPKIAERFVKKVDELYDLSSYEHVIEPSMGEGFIYDYLPPKTRIGLDIQKNHPDCKVISLIGIQKSLESCTNLCWVK